MEPDKAAAYNRNIVAAEVAMRNAVALGDTGAYSRALYVYEWAQQALRADAADRLPEQKQDLAVDRT